MMITTELLNKAYGDWAPPFEPESSSVLRSVHNARLGVSGRDQDVADALAVSAAAAG